jgi:hypothetical protein
MVAALGGVVLAVVFGLAPRLASGAVSSEAYTATRWLMALCAGILFPIALGVAILRERVVDIQFAVSRTVVYGAVSSLVLVILAALHWLLGKLIEQTHLAVGIEAFAAVGLGLVLNRVTEATNRLVDRGLFRRRHAAEKRLQQVMAALPLTNHFRAIGAALVTEPARELELASAAVFYRRAARRARGGDVRAPQGAALPVLAMPVESQRVLRAIVLYGSHHNSTLPDPDEVALLHRIAKAAEASHQQVRIATLTREAEEKQARIGQLEASLAELRARVRARSALP